MSEQDVIIGVILDSAKYVQQHLVGHWIITLLISCYALFAMIYCLVDSDIDMYSMKNPLKRNKVMKAWAFAGFWGGHWAYLNPFSISITKNIWLIFCMVSIIAIAILLNVSLFDSQYIVVALLLYALFFVNFVWGFGRIPFGVDLINAKYYRRHIETDLILKGYELPVDKNLAKISPRITAFNKRLQALYDAVEGVEDGKEDASRIAKACHELNEALKKNLIIQTETDHFLKQYRTAAYRNINLCKDLLAQMKAEDEQTIEQICKSLTDIQKKGDSDVMGPPAGTVIAKELSAITDGISQLVDFKTKGTRKQLTEIKQKLQKLLPRLYKYITKLSRELEETAELSKINSDFVIRYEAINSAELNDKGEINKDYRQQQLSLPDTKTKMEELVAACHGYSNVFNQEGTTSSMPALTVQPKKFHFLIEKVHRLEKRKTFAGGIVHGDSILVDDEVIVKDKEKTIRTRIMGINHGGKLIDEAVEGDKVDMYLQEVEDLHIHKGMTIKKV